MTNLGIVSSFGRASGGLRGSVTSVTIEVGHESDTIKLQSKVS
jgi:hypothetical protein